MRYMCLIVLVFTLSSLVSAYELAYDTSRNILPLDKDCTVISAPGTYILDKDIVRRPDVDTPPTTCPPETRFNRSDEPFCYFDINACLIIRSSDVTLDCQGHSIVIGDWIQYGIWIDENSNNVTIKNCVIDRPYGGITIRPNSSADMLINNTVLKAFAAGYWIQGHDNVLDCNGQKITIDGFEGKAVDISDGALGGAVGTLPPDKKTTWNTTIKNCLIDKPLIGIFDSGVNTTISDNSVFNASYRGYAVAGQGGLISGNLVVQDVPPSPDYVGQYGFDILGGKNKIVGNIAQGANDSCFKVDLGMDNDFISNKAERCNIGFYIIANNNEFTGNEADGNRLDGFMVEPSELYNFSGNVLRNNIATNNGRKDFDLNTNLNILCNGPSCGGAIPVPVPGKGNKTTNATPENPVSVPGIRYVTPVNQYSPTASEFSSLTLEIIGIVVFLALVGLAAWLFWGKKMKKQERKKRGVKRIVQE